ncbi:PEP/pyruvate-binding domain-containing protein [Halodesulfovibrio aestuarii]|uniref:PEP/pyruvate-binding domain-containing protein n=1 Tax=Halodesulfovibrio aestuarii TaxID=126333 RepID=UPI003D3478D6
MSVFSEIRTAIANRQRRREQLALHELKARYHAFRIFLENNGRALELLVEADTAMNHGEYEVLQTTTDRLLSVTGELVDGLNLLSGEAYTNLFVLHGTMGERIQEALRTLTTQAATPRCCIALDSLEPSLYPLAGNKAANLAQLQRIHLPVPDGFVCTTRCCRDFLADNDLVSSIRNLMREVEQGDLEISAAAQLIRESIFKASLPQVFMQELRDAYTALGKTSNSKEGSNERFAISVRSSGVAEDRPDHSFAGQFSSVLNVTTFDALCDAYKEVIASGFSARAIAYRINAGLSPVDFDLAVLCQRMVDAQCAGVMMTRDPARPDSNRLLISAAPGLGTLAVGGLAPVDIYYPWRSDSDGVSTAHQKEPRLRLMDGAEIARKTIREVSAQAGGVTTEAVPESESDAPLLSVDTLQRLVNYGEMIENIEGVAQDVEWAVTHDGTIQLLQARPLRLTTRSGHSLPAPSSAEPLVTGICASSGKAVGRAYLVRNVEELQGAEMTQDIEPRILVLPQALVDAARSLHSYAGVIIDSGNPTDHLSCIAREYGIPLVTSVRNGCEVLQTGQWIVLDADNGLVQPASEHLWNSFAQNVSGASGAGKSAAQIVAPSLETSSSSIKIIGMPEARKALWELLVPLNLTEAYGPTFSWQECRSVHDLVRYTHELAVLAMFDAGDSVMEEAGGLLRPLDLGIPFHFLVIDLGGATRRHEASACGSFLKRAIRNPLCKDDVLSVPLVALCEGLLTPELNWHSKPDAEAFSGIVSRTMLDGRGVRPAGSFNYALAARDYLNLNARVEFHFAMLDAVCGGDAQANYIRFRFKGGGAGLVRGHRRAVFLKLVLEGHGFVTSVIGDLITASLTGASRSVVREQLVMLGRLLGFSRFLDGNMTDDDAPKKLAESFLKGHFDSRDLEEGVA